MRFREQNVWSGATSTQRKIRDAKLTYGIVLDEFAENREHVTDFPV